MRKNILAPSILAADFTNLGEEIREAVRGGAGYMHLDVMDGIFVPNFSFGMPVISSIRKVTQVPFDVHLMIQQPERYNEILVGCGADLITVHSESTVHLNRVIHQIKDLGIRACVALNPTTPLNALDYILEDVDMVLIMTVNPGFGGQHYIPQMTEKIRTLRRQILEMGREIDIEVDGGISEDTIRTVLEAGANVIVAGSSVFSGRLEDIQPNEKKLLAIMEEYTEYNV